MHKISEYLSTHGRGSGYILEKVVDTFFKDDSYLDKYNWVVLPDFINDFETARNSKNIVICHIPSHDMPDDSSIFLKDEEIVKNTVAYVVQSEWQKNDIIKNFGIDESKIHIINSFMSPILDINKDKNWHVNMTYIFQMGRGIDLLFEVFSLIKDKNISLNAHTCSCSECLNEIQKLSIKFNEKRIKSVGYTSKEDLYKSLSKSHITVYPCTFEETGCISMMEAMSAGNLIICSDLGVLPELVKDFGIVVPGISVEFSDKQRKKFVKKFAKEIKKGIRKIRREAFDPSSQINYVNSWYIWSRAEKDWKDFFNLVDSLY